jgi:hypothetical protein
MGVLIDETNFKQFLKQSTNARGSAPDGNIYFDDANDRIQLIGVDELATFDHTGLDPAGGASDANQLTNFDGITLRGLYNFENQERRVDNTLRTFLRGSKGTYRFAGAFDFVNGVKLDDTVLVDTSQDRNKIRGSGWIEFAGTQDGKTDVDRIYHGIGSLVDVQATTAPQFALVADVLEATLQAATWAAFQRVGDINEAVQVFGSTAFGDTNAGTQDDTLNILVVRVRSWGYNPGETTSVATNIAEFSGFAAGYGVGESINPANTFDEADVYGGSQVAPWTGMSLVKAAATDKVGENFNEAGAALFTWILLNTGAGTAQQCAAFLDALTLQAGNIDDGAGTYLGDKGRVWYARDAAGLIVTVSNESEGLFIDGLSVAEKQNVKLTDDTDVTRTYPFFPDVQISVGPAAILDNLAWYSVFYVDGAASADFDTATAVRVRNSVGANIEGNVQANAVGEIISFAYAYDTDTDAGLPDTTDKAIVVIVEGDGGVEQAITYATIKRDPIVPITCAPSADNNA